MGKQEYPDNTTDLPQVTDKRNHIILYWVHIAMSVIQDPSLDVIRADCIGSYKYNNHMITTTTTPSDFQLYNKLIDDFWFLFIEGL